jgi:hypothetical protein
MNTGSRPNAVGVRARRTLIKEAPRSLVGAVMIATLRERFDAEQGRFVHELSAGELARVAIQVRESSDRIAVVEEGSSGGVDQRYLRGERRRALARRAWSAH